MPARLKFRLWHSWKSRVALLVRVVGSWKVSRIGPCHVLIPSDRVANGILFSMTWSLALFGFLLRALRGGLGPLRMSWSGSTGPLCCASAMLAVHLWYSTAVDSFFLMVATMCLGRSWTLRPSAAHASAMALPLRLTFCSHVSLSFAVWWLGIQRRLTFLIPILCTCFHILIHMSTIGLLTSRQCRLPR